MRSIGPAALSIALFICMCWLFPLAISQEDGQDPSKLVKVWEFQKTGSEATFWKLDWSPDGRLVAAVFFDGECVLLNASDGGINQVLSTDPEPTRCDGFSPEGTLPLRTCAFSPDGRYLALAGDGRNVHVYDITTWELAMELVGHLGTVASLDFSPDSRYLASGSGRDKVLPSNAAENIVIVWDMTSGERVLELTGHADGVLAVKWSPDGTRIATGSDDRTVRVWSLPEGEELFSSKGHTSGVLDLDWFPDGSRLISGSRDYKIKVWNSSTGENLATWSDYNCVRSVDVHPEAELAATSGVDLTLKIRDLRTGTELKVIKDGMEQKAMVMSSRWSPDGTSIASGLGKSHSVILYSFGGEQQGEDGGLSTGVISTIVLVVMGSAALVVIFYPAFKELRGRRD